MNILKQQKSNEKNQNDGDMEQEAMNEEDDENLENKETTDATSSSTLYRTPEFVWSEVQIRLLSDLLNSIEGVVEEWTEQVFFFEFF